jgi:SanA protein
MEYSNGKISSMLRRILKMFLWFISLALFAALLVFAAPRSITAILSIKQVFSAQDVPSKPVAIVFGAGLWRDGSPTPVLRDRVTTAAQLYFDGKVEKLLMSGDNSYVEYNEPGAMHGYALELGVPDKAITLDYAGRRTYDTCYRARAIFGIQEAILVTQSFHLSRALYTCKILGLDAVGVPADKRIYRRRSLIYWNLREIPASLVAFWELHITHPKPILGNPEPIFPTEAQ